MINSLLCFVVKINTNERLDKSTIIRITRIISIHGQHCCFLFVVSPSMNLIFTES